MSWNHSGDRTITLAQSTIGTVQRCRHEGYHINIDHITLHLSPKGLRGLADLIWKANEREIQNQGFSFLSFEREEE